uniref:Uncharacterized protein n=1 Tax=Arundo donax TaxID=35708 RepID=A0A0A8Y3G5_ARUDO
MASRAPPTWLAVTP